MKIAAMNLQVAELGVSKVEKVMVLEKKIRRRRRR